MFRDRSHGSMREHVTWKDGIMKVEFLGHAGFLLEGNGVRLVIDPFLTGNPLATRSADEIGADYVLVTHAHQDHIGDAAAIARAGDALVIATFEVAGLLEKEGVKTHAMHVGGTREFEFGSVRITPAVHGSGVPGGLACGFIIDFWGQTVYHAGDTGLFGDMELLGELVDIDLALLPIGGNFTMDAGDAVEAVAMLDPEMVIPMHYDTFPVIEADPEEFKRMVEAQLDARVIILRPGQDLEV